MVIYKQQLVISIQEQSYYIHAHAGGTGLRGPAGEDGIPGIKGDMVPAKYTCPTGWTREYYGYLMAEYHGHRRSQFSCVDTAFKPVTGSSANRGGLLFYFVEGRCGSLPCPPYDNTKELSCAICTK